MTRQDLRTEHKWGLVPMEQSATPKVPAHQGRPSPWQRALHDASTRNWRNLWGMLK